MQNKTQIAIKGITFLFVIIHSIFYILLYGVGMFQSIEKKIIYAMVISCLLFRFLLLILEKKRNFLYLFLAFLFTSISDTFLVLYDTGYEIAVFSFILVQWMYCIYIHETFHPHQKWKNQLIMRSILIVFALIGICFVDRESKMLLFLTIIYIGNFILNIVFAFSAKEKQGIFILGLLLFFLCDICVGCFNIGDILPISSNAIFEKIKSFPINLSWFFYYPSQILLAISTVIPMKKKTIFKKYAN